MASARELITLAIARAEELMARPRVDWTVAQNWAGDTIEVLKIIYGDGHHKVTLFRDAGQPGAVRLIHSSHAAATRGDGETGTAPASAPARAAARR
jgi:hypothetical protein